MRDRVTPVAVDVVLTLSRKTPPPAIRHESDISVPHHQLVVAFAFGSVLLPTNLGVLRSSPQEATG